MKTNTTNCFFLIVCLGSLSLAMSASAYDPQCDKVERPCTFSMGLTTCCLAETSLPDARTSVGEETRNVIATELNCGMKHKHLVGYCVNPLNVPCGSVSDGTCRPNPI